jgi:hypothetical protein
MPAHQQTSTLRALLQEFNASRSLTGDPAHLSILLPHDPTAHPANRWITPLTHRLRALGWVPSRTPQEKATWTKLNFRKTPKIGRAATL